MAMDLSQLRIPAGTPLTIVDVEPGGTNIQHVEHYHTKEPKTAEPFEEAYALLDKLTRGLMAQGKADAKSLLLPYQAAIKAAAIPRLGLEDFNARYGVKLTSSGFSDYAGTNSRYLDADLEPYMKQFLKLETGTSGT